MTLNGELYGASFRGIVADIDGVAVGVAGIVHTDRLQLFSSFGDEVRRYPMLMIRAARKIVKIMGIYDSPVYAIADEEVDGSVNFLEHMGFKHYQGRVYRCRQHLHT